MMTSVTTQFLLLLLAGYTVTAVEIGFDVIDREKLDTWKRVTYIDVKNTFQADGRVDAVEFYAGAKGVGRPLLVSIFEKAESGDCTFRMLNQLTVKATHVGENTITLPVDDRLNVKAGNYFGFTWKRYSVVEFDWVEDKNYCAGKVNPKFGLDFKLPANGKRMLNREYSIKLHTTPSEPESSDCDCSAFSAICATNPLACMKLDIYSDGEVSTTSSNCMESPTCNLLILQYSAVCQSGIPNRVCAECVPYTCPAP